MEHRLDKAFVSFRIGVPQWLSDERFEALMRLFEKHKGVTDEITFFTSETHPPLPLDTIRQRVDVLSRRMPAVRQLGYRTGINLLATIGHHNEALPQSLSSDFTRMTDINGHVCQGSFCPNDERMRGTIRRVYTLLASARPDYIWIDDDVRLFGHMPIMCGCFCDTCLAIFEKSCGTRYTRESLRAAMNTGDLSRKLAVRRAWLRHNRNTLARLFELIEQTVHTLRPDLPLGFMTGDRFFEGYDFDTWARILSGSAKAEVMWRPGGGTYTDHWLDGIVQKAHQIGRQTALLPASVRSIQSEVESFPYQRLEKSVRATCLEGVCYIMGGCTGAAFNVLSQHDEPLDEYDGLVAGLKRARPFFDLLARTFGRAGPIGVYTGWTKDSFVARNADGGDWLDGGSVPGTHHADALLAGGIPAAYAPQQACVTALTGDSVLAMGQAEVTAMLSKGVYMDGPALRRLNEMGYQELTGFAIERTVREDCIEQFVGHPLNGGFSGRHRNGRQSFWREPAHLLSRSSQSAQILSRVVDYGYRQVAPCGMGVFENRLGGRVCVAGYYPWTHLQSLSKSSQLKSVLRWLSKDTLPAYVASYHRINVWVRPLDGGGGAVALLNAYLDPAENVEVLLRTNAEQIKAFDMQCCRTTVRSVGVDGPYRRFVLPQIPPWEIRLLIA